MTPRERKNRTFIANGLKTERYQHLVDEKITSLFPSGEETAIIRKEIARLIDVLSEKFPDIHMSEEYENYNKKAEEVKKTIRSEMVEGKNEN